ncbi:TPA: 50S ribosomal protein L32 [Candidatus Shapirobacteria bacterium]|nr:50S ribosomal protein L32 [Candidatus Shapirobacteria bacterium]HCU54839.1 50S ribosomal protein L32 [Candidatus Shapirobacteria bacterium]
MTALPKHWPSSRRQGKRRASQKNSKTLTKPVICKHCGFSKRAGFLCPNCKQ